MLIVTKTLCSNQGDLLSMPPPACTVAPTVSNGVQKASFWGEMPLFDLILTFFTLREDGNILPYSPLGMDSFTREAAKKDRIEIGNIDSHYR